MRIVDTFCYFNEAELLELRIKLLRDHVDQFLIFEGDRTFRGDPKPLTCVQTLTELGLMSDKIRVITVNLPSKQDEPNDWNREHIQKDALSKYVEDDMVMICSDLDEIMDPKYIDYYVKSALANPNCIIRIPMWWLIARGDLQLFSPTGEPVRNMCAFIGLPHHFKEYNISTIRLSYARRLFNIPWKDTVLTDNGVTEIAGWHLTWMGSKDRRIKKFLALTSHQGLLDTAPGNGKDESILEFMESYLPQDGSTDPLGRRDHILKRFDTSLLPKIIWQTDRVKDFLFPPEEPMPRESAKQIIPNDPLIQQLYTFIDDPDSPLGNINLAIKYDELNQWAAAVSYYIRAAERSEDSLFQYTALIRASMCFNRLGTRGLSVRGLLNRAITLLPRRPEAYYLLAKWFENEKQVESWVNCYTTASMALSVCDFGVRSAYMPLDYPGRWALLFEKAVSAWWVGLCDESRDIFKELLTRYPLDDQHRQAVINNLAFMNQFVTKQITAYDRTKLDRLKVKFPGIESIDRNYSEAYQDMLVLSLLNGKKNGTYVEIGAGNPFYGNNTALLETVFGWNGFSVDFDEKLVANYNSSRQVMCVHGDALKLDYSELLATYDRDIDYLQIDIDPPDNSLAVLKKIPFDKHRFAVITFEHDAYCQLHPTVREESRKYLSAHGYRMIARNIAPDDWRNYEDWWYHPDLVSAQNVFDLQDTSEATKSAESYFLKP